MARRAVVSAAIVIICAALQLTVVQFLAIRRVAPDLLLVVVAVMGLLSGPRAGMAMGFSVGVIEGALLGRSIGVYAGARTIVGYLAGIIGRRVFTDNLLVIAGAVAVLTLVNEAILDIFGRPAGLWTMVAAGVGRAAYNAAAALLIGAGLRRMRGMLPPEEVGP